MKLIVLFFALISISAYSQNTPKVNFHLLNGDVKQYSIADINDIKIQAVKSNYMLKIFYNDTLSNRFNIRSIESIVFEKDKNGIEILNIYKSGQPIIFILANIDSINFFLPQFNTPEILEINPVSAKIGGEITINGFNFGKTRGKSTLSFLGKDASEFNSWTDTLIKVIVPKGAQSGNLAVTVNGIKSNDIDFSIIPFISQIYPTTAGVTEYISVYGSGFGNVKSGEFSFNNAKATEYPLWTDSYLSVTVPIGARSGKVFLTVNGIKSNEFNFNVIQHIFSIEPDSAQVGDLVVLKGTKFGSQQGNSLVYFSSTPVTEYKSWSDTEISLIVPDKARSGRVTANINDLSSNNVQFYLIPYLSYVTPDSARLNSIISITGTGFGDLQENGEVSFNGVKAEVYTGWSSKSIAVKVPPAAKSGKVSVTIADIKSNEADFGVLPSIISISPAAANAGDEISIHGVSFKDKRGSSFVTFNNNKTVTDNTSWSDTLIKVKVPEGTVTGSVIATIGEYTTNQVLFSIKPRISSINPTSGLVGNFITISGSYFGSERDSGYVTFGTAKATVYTSWSDTLIEAKIPAGASTGKLTVTANNLKSNGVDFTCTGGNYEEVKIGKQIWMLKNLDVSTYRNGDPIPEVPLIAEWANLSTGAYCYHDNDPAYGQVYGKLYNWYAVMDPRGLAPDGWHIPSDQEMIELCIFLGGDDVAGGKLKETGTAHWQRPNTGATNESGFTGLPGSYRSFFQWSVLEAEGFLWTTTEFSSARAWYWSLAYDSPTFFRNNQPKFHGLSVRCIKD